MKSPQLHNPEPVPGVELFRFQTLPHDPEALPHNLEIPTRTIRGVEAIGHTTVQFTLEMPEHVLDPIPLGVAHGWFGFEGAYADLRHWVAQNGKPACTVQPTRVLKDRAGYHPQHLLHPEKLLCQTMYGAMKGIRKSSEAEAMGIDASQGDLFAHSMGGRTAAYVATLRPDLVRSITFAAPAGFEPHSVPEFLTHRIPNFVTNEVPQAYLNGHLRPYLKLGAAKELAHYALGGGLRALREGISIGSSDIRQTVEKLGDLGVKTALLEFEADALIPAYSSLKHSGRLVDLAALFPYPQIGHLGPQTHPELTGQAQFEILDVLNGTNLRSRKPIHSENSSKKQAA